MTEEQAAELARLDTRIARLRAGGPSRAKELARAEDTKTRLAATYRRGPGRPALPPEERRIMVALRLRPEILAKVDELADDAGLSRVGMIERLIERAKRPS